MKITKEKINSLPSLLEDNQITMKDAVNILWEHMYRFPHYYGFSDLKEDEQSDFLIFISGKIPRFFKEFKKEKKCTFHTFVVNIVRFAKLGYIRKCAQKNTERLSYLSNQEIEFENQYFEYQKLEPENCINDFTDTKSITKNDLSKIHKRKQIAKETALFLLFKSCHSVEDKHIKAVCELTGENEDEIFKKIELLRNKSMEHLDNKKVYYERARASFYMRKKYNAQLEKVNQDSSIYNILKKRLNSQNRVWNTSLFVLSRKRPVAPSNEMIGEILNIPARTVTRYLSNAKKANGYERAGSSDKSKIESEVLQPIEQEKCTVENDENMIDLEEEKTKNK